MEFQQYCEVPHFTSNNIATPWFCDNTCTLETSLSQGTKQGLQGTKKKTINPTYNRFKMSQGKSEPVLEKVTQIRFAANRKRPQAISYFEGVVKGFFAEKV